MSIRTIAAMFAVASVLLAPAAVADTGTNGVGHSGKGQTHRTASEVSPAPPTELAQHILNQLVGHH